MNSRTKYSTVVSDSDKRSVAAHYGLYEAIPLLLYARDITSHSILFVEHVEDDLFTCYRLTWKNSERISSSKIYLHQGTFIQALDKAEYITKWFINQKK